MPAEVLEGGDVLDGLQAAQAVSLRPRHRETADVELAVSTDDAEAMARRLAREEPIVAAASSGVNLVAAMRLPVRSGRAPGWSRSSSTPA